MAMTACELFEEFKNYCNDYKIIDNNIVVENGEKQFILFNPGQSNRLIYTAILERGRLQGAVSDIDELLEMAIDIVGREKFIVKRKQKCISNYFEW